MSLDVLSRVCDRLSSRGEYGTIVAPVTDGFTEGRAANERYPFSVVASRLIDMVSIGMTLAESKRERLAWYVTHRGTPPTYIYIVAIDFRQTRINTGQNDYWRRLEMYKRTT